MEEWNIQMPKFMRSHDDAGETTSVLHDRHTIHLINKAKQSNNSKKTRE